MKTKEQTEDLDPYHLGDRFEGEELAMLTKKFKEDDELEKMLFGKVFSHDIESLEDIENIPPINPKFKEIFKMAKIDRDNCNKCETISEEYTDELEEDSLDEYEEDDEDFDENEKPSETELFVKELFRRAKEEGTFTKSVNKEEISKKEINNKAIKNKAMKAVSGLVIMLVLVSAIIYTSRNNETIASNKPNAFVKVYHYVKYSVLGAEQGAKKKVTEEYGPTYIPEGYEKVEDINSNTSSRIEYKNSQEKLLFLQTPNYAKTKIDKENIKADKKVINGTDYYVTEKEKDILIVWCDKKYQYKITTSDKTLAIKELLKMAESAKEN